MAEPSPAQVELRRIRRRWEELPPQRRATAAPFLRELAQSLADATGEAQGRGRLVIPDLGEAVLPDQLSVMAYDAEAAGAVPDLAERLGELRRRMG